jgi:hypothetical protein
MGQINDIDGAGVSSFNDLTNKPITTVTQTLTVGDNTVTHNIGTAKSQTVVDVVVYDGTEQIPVSNWVIASANAITLNTTIGITNARIEIISK